MTSILEARKKVTCVPSNGDLFHPLLPSLDNILSIHLDIKIISPIPDQTVTQIHITLSDPHKVHPSHQGIQ